MAMFLKKTFAIASRVRVQQNAFRKFTTAEPQQNISNANATSQSLVQPIVEQPHVIDPIFQQFLDKTDKMTDDEAIEEYKRFKDELFPPLASRRHAEEEEEEEEEEEDSEVATESQSDATTTSPTESESQKAHFDVKSLNLDELYAPPPFKPSAERTSDEDLRIIKGKFDFDTVAVRYAFLLYSTFKNNKILDKLNDQIAILKKDYEDKNIITELIDNNLMSQNQRHTQLNEYLEKSKFHTLFQGFLFVASKHGRLQSIPDIINSLTKIRASIEKDTNVLTVVSAEKLSPKQKDDIANMILTKFKPDGKLLVNEVVDKSLGGGFELFYEDKYHLDNSQKTVSQDLNQRIESAVSSFFSEQDKQRQASYEAALKEGTPENKQQ